MVADPLGWRSRAVAAKRHIVLADGDDPRAEEAAATLESLGLARVTLAGDSAGARAVPVTAAMQAVVDGLQREVDISDPLIRATLMVAAGEADGCVAGATRPTADVLRAGIRVLGVAPEAEAVSSSFFFLLPDGRPIVYGDCGVIPEPDVGQLASIAIASAATFAELAAEEPKVAMLSFSTKGSAEHDRVDKVRAATALAAERAPELAIDGELQFDAAWDVAVGQAKAPGSPVAGQANVFIFPDLDSGNIGYKITQRLGGAEAFGPLLQGLNGVMHDLSRGATASDIVNVAVIACLQAQARS